MGKTPDELAKDKIFVLKGSERIGPFKAAVNSQKRQIEVFVKDLDADVGDSVLRPTSPNRAEEVYEILDVHYEVPVDDVFAYYTLDVKRQGVPEKPNWRGSPTINISNSQGIQIGDYNAQRVVNMLESLAAEIDQADAPEDQKVEARSHLQVLLSHPLVTSLLGGAAGGLAGELANKS